MQAPMQDAPIYKLVNRSWKTLPDKGEDVFIKDTRLKEGHLGDLKKKPVLELEEILQRQDRTLGNRYLVQKLKDKGESLRKRRQEVAEALETAREREKSSQTEKSLTDVNEMEWRGCALNGCRKTGKMKEVLDSDDDDDESDCEEALDPLRLMAYHSSDVKRPAGGGSRVEDSDPSESIAKELHQLALTDGTDPDTQPQDFGSQRILKMEEKQRRNGPKKDSFKPFRPVSNPQPLPNLMPRARRASDRTTICLPMEEAIKREKEYVLKEKRQQIIERVTDKKLGTRISSAPRYRDTNLDRHLLDLDAEEDEWEDDVHITLPLPDDEAPGDDWAS